MMSQLFALFAAPLLFAFSLALAPFKVSKKIAVILSLFPLALLVGGLSGEASFLRPWLSSPEINFHLAVDELSYVFLFLVALVTPMAFLAISEEIPHFNGYAALVLVVQSFLIAFFSARDLVMLVFFYEAMLVPIYFLMTVWGSKGAREAALQFLVYMVAGSILLIASLVGIYLAAGTFDMALLAERREELFPFKYWLAAAFFLAFAVKTPLFPFHAWLPATYCTSSKGVTLLLAALLSKTGIYGFLRVGREIFPLELQQQGGVLLLLAIAGVLYGALVAWSESDFKRMIAYSSFSHVNFILCGVFVWDVVSSTGALLQAVNHSVTILWLFILAGWLQERIGSTSMNSEGGLAAALPRLCWFTLFFVLASVGVPGLNNFVGELLILFGLFSHHPYLASILILSVILSVLYMLRWMRKMYFGPATTLKGTYQDLKNNEVALLAPWIALTLFLGLYPMPLLTQFEKFFKQGLI